MNKGFWVGIRLKQRLKGSKDDPQNNREMAERR